LYFQHDWAASHNLNVETNMEIRYPDPLQAQQDDGLFTLYNGVLIPCTEVNTGVPVDDCTL